MLDLLARGLTLVEQCPGRTRLDALAAARARRRITPWLAEVGHEQRLDTTTHDLPRASAFDFFARPHAPGAQNAAIGVEGKHGMRGVDRTFGVAIGKGNMVDAKPVRHGLQAAVAVGDTHGTNVVAFGKQHLHDHAAVLCKPLRFGLYHHAFSDQRHAGRQKLVDSLDLGDTEPAGADVGDSILLTERGNVHVVRASHLQDRLVVPAAHFLTVYG